jgi:hypothetical protein
LEVAAGAASATAVVLESAAAAAHVTNAAWMQHCCPLSLLSLLNRSRQFVVTGVKLPQQLPSAAATERLGSSFRCFVACERVFVGFCVRQFVLLVCRAAAWCC